MILINKSIKQLYLKPKMYGGSIGLSMRQIYMILFGVGVIVTIYIGLIFYGGYLLIHG